ncbi:hypothetical protein M1105_08970 [Limibaculum sp. FT325]|uniref:Flp family type IVb pilin n=1 Tax=Thermohalobaculum sediminis TaxID=2939436 RepID=UPI0020BF113A|nr:hypothetical protein [Limibaculum sediminis]MCL5777116.1 hypothetical protein [Limibaculum sediminis]
MTKFVKFLKDEDGAITIEWVALAAGVIILALGVIAVLDDALVTVAGNIASTIETSTDNLLSQALSQSTGG